MLGEAGRVLIYFCGEVLIGAAGYVANLGVIPDATVLFIVLGALFFVLLELHIRHGHLSSSQTTIHTRLGDVVSELSSKISHISEVGVIHGEPELAQKFNQIKQEAAANCYMIWSGVYTDIDVKRYFQDEAILLNSRPRLHITRLINPLAAGLSQADFAEHKQIMQNVTGGRYVYETSGIENIEIVFADHAEGGRTTYRGMLVLLGRNDHKPHIGFLLDTARFPQLSEVTHSVAAIFDNIRTKEKQVFPGYP